MLAGEKVTRASRCLDVVQFPPMGRPHDSLPPGSGLPPPPLRQRTGPYLPSRWKAGGANQNRHPQLSPGTEGGQWWLSKLC